MKLVTGLDVRYVLRGECFSVLKAVLKAGSPVVARGCGSLTLGVECLQLSVFEKQGGVL